MAWLAALVGMGWLALSLKAHWRQVAADRPYGGPAVFTLRLAGAGALFISLLMCLWVDHPSMAALVWVMLLAGAAFSVALLLAWRAHWLAPLLVLTAHAKA